MRMIVRTTRIMNFRLGQYCMREWRALEGAGKGVGVGLESGVIAWVGRFVGLWRLMGLWRGVFFRDGEWGEGRGISSSLGLV